MTPVDALGVVGVGLILIAYAGATSGRLDARRAPALLLNLAGALLILVSLYFDFNLSAVLMEGAWALVAVIGLVRLALGGRRTPD
ncbi:MAG: CBU_0592 family membrane protein [Brevundimonas sp.]